MRTHLKKISVVELNFKNLGCIFKMECQFWAQCGNSDISVATFVTNFFKLLDFADLDTVYLPFVSLKRVLGYIDL